MAGNTLRYQRLAVRALTHSRNRASPVGFIGHLLPTLPDDCVRVLTFSRCHVPGMYFSRTSCVRSVFVVFVVVVVVVAVAVAVARIPRMRICRPLLRRYRTSLRVAPHRVSFPYSSFAGGAVHPELYRENV